ncbi:hypothetical protein BDY21DRAFT_343490 [Lineolata rhizophorae]|uniref:Aminomethyltransferase folate-binding domain-containing protein n=1 Tax=Lineolata rhizophorae TaxID=578093 RepID=A0A6A6P208_9PEZI|nr:hypothetical protein BDY21DRAFT_343490 [Lineolata rhizophorae]
MDWHKGCYVGQELTVSSHHRGALRKLVVPWLLYGEEDNVLAVLERRDALRGENAEEIPGEHGILAV